MKGNGNLNTNNHDEGKIASSPGGAIEPGVNSANYETMEVQPLFRAMRMVNAEPTEITMSFDLPLEKPGIQTERSYTGKDVGAFSEQGVARKSGATVQSSQVKLEIARAPVLSDVPDNLGWREPILTHMSFYYPLSPSYLSFPKSELHLVLQRLLEVFRALSLETVFQDSPLEASCRSLEQVELSVNLWESRDDSSQAILEVQRIAGDTVVFCKYMRRILEASVAKYSGAKPSEAYTDSVYLDKTESILCRLPVAEDSDVPATIGIVLQLLLTDRIDSRCLALESLVILTDPGKTRLPMAATVARAVLLGSMQTADGITLTDMRIRDCVLCLSLLGRWPDSPDSTTDDRAHIHLALIIMANAISLLKEPAEIVSILDTSAYLTGVSLISVMQEHVWRAREEPHWAFLAARILSALCRGQASTVRGCIEIDSIRRAQYVGQCSHAALESEIGRLLSALEV